MPAGKRTAIRNKRPRVILHAELRLPHAAREISADAASSARADRFDFDALGRLPWARFDVLAASLTLNILALALPVVILQTYDRILPNNSRDTLLMLVLGIGVVLIFDAALRLGRSYVTGWAAARFQYQRGQQAIAWLLRSKLPSFEKDAAGAYLDRLHALDTLRDFYSGQAMLALVDLPFALLFLCLVAYLGGMLVLVPVFLLVAFSLLAWRSGTRLRNAVAARSAVDDRRYNFIIEVLTGIHTIKSLGMEALMTRRYERLQQSCAAAGYDVNRLSGEAQALSALFSQLSLISVAGIGSLVVIDGGMTMGGLAACTLLAGRSLQPLLRAMGIWTQFQNIRVARENLQRIYEVEPESVTTLPAMPRISGALKLSGVRFGYHDDEGPLLFDGLDLQVKAGEVVGICGENGSGKSSLLWLVMGLIQPLAGTVRMDGHDPSRFAADSVRSQIAYIPQHGVLFQGSILENLTSFRGDDFVEPAIETATRLGLDEVVARMPQGYQTRVGNTSFDAVPGGIKQRIAIARALVSRPRIILFDEANSSLDGAGDAHVRQLLGELKGDRTILLVSHRPSLLKLADRIYDIHDGRLHERPRLSERTDNPLVAMHFPA